MIDVQIIPILEDNYAYLLQADDGTTAIVDPGEASPIMDVLKERDLTLDYVINTHHHWDHTDGNEELMERYGAQLVAPAAEAEKISKVDIKLAERDVFMLGEDRLETFETPGHTAGHICLYAPESKVVFTGDTLFLMGCGRLFEGTAKQMWNSFQKLKTLPDETKIYCGHEYTLSLGEFCLRIEPENEDLRTRLKTVRDLRAHNKPTIPGTMGEEKRTNLFMRAESPERFAEIRRLRDNS
ncbi:MAG: hydroxyacylglutathione hydrolase [Alphaproteobacteria bacterium]|nr:hydroxyacylglutathione hydrolase [Alphaproteobacteria bacterium]